MPRRSGSIHPGRHCGEISHTQASYPSTPCPKPHAKANIRTRFIGEETYSAGTSRQYLVDSSPTWIVDPLDGTVNFTHIFPMFCVSIAFAVNGHPVIGVINAPFLAQLFTSCKGRGAWLNETQQLPLLRDPVPPLPENAPRGCIFSCEWGKDRGDGRDGNLARKIDSFVAMALEPKARGGLGGMVHGVRSLGRYVYSQEAVGSHKG